MFGIFKYSILSLYIGVQSTITVLCKHSQHLLAECSNVCRHPTHDHFAESPVVNQQRFSLFDMSQWSFTRLCWLLVSIAVIWETVLIFRAVEWCKSKCNFIQMGSQVPEMLNTWMCLHSPHSGICSYDCVVYKKCSPYTASHSMKACYILLNFGCPLQSRDHSFRVWQNW